MGSLPPELSLDFRPSFVPKPIGEFLKEVSMIGDFDEKGMKVGGFVKRLEEEMGKIDAFKRELPLCMLLLRDAISGLKNELLQLTPPKAQPEPVLEEFIPTKESENEEESERSDKKRWMSTFQLYDYQSVDDPPKRKEIKRKEEEESNTTSEVSEFPIQNHEKSNVVGRAFFPFSDLPAAALRKEEREELPIPDLSLLMPGTKNLREESDSSVSKTCCSLAANVPTSLGARPSQSQGARKQRRCWSPELHRRFVNALQQLGGPQVATPKQIREHMKVDGLTNDEVKSHLQKYRLHTRRATSNQSVVLGNLCTPRAHCSQSSNDSPQGPFQLGTHDSTTVGDSIDDDDDEEDKSESYSWKNNVNKSGA